MLQGSRVVKIESIPVKPIWAKGKLELVGDAERIPTSENLIQHGQKESRTSLLAYEPATDD